MPQWWHRGVQWRTLRGNPVTWQNTSPLWKQDIAYSAPRCWTYPHGSGCSCTWRPASACRGVHNYHHCPCTSVSPYIRASLLSAGELDFNRSSENKYGTETPMATIKSNLRRVDQGIFCTNNLSMICCMVAAEMTLPPPHVLKTNKEPLFLGLHFITMPFSVIFLSLSELTAWLFLS